MTGHVPAPGDIRPSQLVSTFGPGSIYDNLKDSLLILGTDKWDKSNFRSLRHETLLYHLQARYPNLKEFRVPFQDESGKAIHIRVRTFPTWGVCRTCGLLLRRNLAAGTGSVCTNKECPGLKDGKSRKTIPVRFVVACRNGHLDDFPWYRWVHRSGSTECSRNKATLFLEDDPSGASLEHKWVRCETCGLRVSLGAALSPDGMRGVYTAGCKGSMPWLGIAGFYGDRAGQGCDELPKGMYKGATNMYFPHTVRALTIPPFAGKTANDVIGLVKIMEGQNMLADEIDERVPPLIRKATVKEVQEIIRAYRRRTKGGYLAGNIKAEEYIQLNGQSHPENGTDTDWFKTEPIEIPDNYTDTLSNAVLVRRVREIVALTGFYRVDPPITKSDYARKAPLGRYESGSPEWLPAAENRGEGIFLALNKQRVSEWEKSHTEIEARCAKMFHKRSDMLESLHAEPSAKYVLLHTMSHMLIREVSAYAGYATASIRERIYSGDGMEGILLYTSSPSSDGSLGGLVEQGVKPRLDVIMNRMLRKVSACSTDPFCANAAVDNKSIRGAACHACLFLPETSCECMNHFLDRALVVSQPGTKWGYFKT